MQASEDSRLQNRIAQLNLIVARRNEFLRELFRLLRSRDDITANSLEDEDEELVMFLKRFDLNRDPGRGSISNLVEDEFSFHIRGSRSLHPNVVSSPDNDNASATSSRTTRSRARAEEVPPPLPFGQQATRKVVVDTDEENDELDLIGSSGFSEEGDRAGKPKLDTRTRGTTGNELLFPDTATTRPRHREIANNSERLLTSTATRTDAMEVEQDESPRNLESSRDKDDAMDVEEVEAITKASDADGTDQEAPESAKVIVEKSLTIVGGPTNKVPSRESSTSTPSKTMAQITNSVNIPKPILISTSSVSNDEKVIKQEGGTESGVVKREPFLESHRQFNPKYSLPPLNVLPADFTKKAKPIKRKKDKERESKRDKDDTVPLGLARWGATLMANPLWRKVSRANKTLSTREWSVAMVELRLIRTMERIEQLKNDGRWSFRQPKKQRGVGGLVKSHWDYLIDEMKWMRIDFREERRWKIALAYNLSTAVLEWHYAQTPEERQRAGITVKWRRPYVQQNIEMATESPLEEADMAFKPTQLLGLDYGSDDDDDEEGEEEEEEENDQDDLLDPLEPSAAIRDALDLANDIQPKNEDVDDQSVLNLVQSEALDASPQPTPDTRSDEDVKPGLKSTSENPLLSGSKSSSQSVSGDNDTTVVVDAKPPKSSLAPLREKVVYSDDLFFNPNSDTLEDSVPQSDLDLSTLFPDLQPFGILDIPTNLDVANGETRKKSEKKSDRDDPTKRAEEMNYTKLYPSSRFMHIKPTLIGPLQPAKRFKDDSWLPIDPQSVSAEFDSRIPEDVSNDLFDGRPSSTLQFHASSLKDKDARKRAVDHLWSPNDDTLLKQLVDRYSTNWALVAECYNSARLTTPMERRTPIDCAERWKERWSAERKLQPSEAPQPAAEDGTATSSPNQMTTRAVKRRASTSVSGTPGATVGGEKKRRRHYLLQESIKKAAKKRSDSIQKMLANQRKPSTVHETHNQFNKLPKLTPLELARMKADKDQRESHEVQLARRRQEEAMRQNLLREQAQRNMLQNGQGQLPQQQQQQNQPQQTQQAQPPQAPQAQAQQGQIPQQQQAALTQQQQQLAQLQLQAQQQANQTAGRVNVPAVVLQNRPTRMNAGAPNARPVNPQTQAQLLQQARMQVPMQLPPGAQANLAQALSQAQAAGNTGAQLTGNPYYPLPANLGNLTQEQILNAIAMQSSQHAQQQQPSQLT